VTQSPQWVSQVDPLADEALALNPVGLGVFARREDAVLFAGAQDDSLVRVRSLPIGWVDPQFSAQA